MKLGWCLGLSLVAMLACPQVHGEEKTLSSASGQPIRAQLIPIHQTTLSAEIAGKIARLTVREGERFQEGQPLVELDCAIHIAQLKKAQATLVAASKKAEVNLRLGEMRSISRVEVDLAAAEAAKAEADVDIQQATVAKCVIHAPFAGRVTKQLIYQYQYLAEGAPVLEILDDQSLEMELIVPSRWLNRIQPETTFTIRIDETEKSYPARITILGAKVNSVSQSIKLIGKIDGSFPELLAGMSGTVAFAFPPP